MKRFITTLLAALCGISILAQSAAAAPSTPCTSYAGLADADRDGYCVFVGAATVNSSGWFGRLDCDDSDKAVFPGASEIVADGIDQSCDGADLVYLISAPTRARYVANSYGGKDPKAETFVEEYDRCKAATGRCTPNDVKGTFDIADPEKDILCDVHIGGSVVMGADGIREVVTLEVASHRYPDVKVGDQRCNASGGSSASGTGSGTGSGVGRTYIDGSAAVLREEAKKEREERMAAEAALEGQVGALEEAARASAEASAAAEAGLATLDDALAEEIRRRQEHDKLLRGDIVDLEAADVTLTENVDAAASRGPLLEVYGLAGAMYGAPVVDDMILRQAGLYGLGAGLNVGLDGDGYRAVAFTTLVVGRDGGVGPAHVEMIGVEAMLERPRAAFGGFGAYGTRHSQTNGLQSAVVGRSVLAGVSLARADASAKHPTVLLRAGCGPEFISAAGSGGVASAVSGTCSIAVGLGGGVGALR